MSKKTKLTRISFFLLITFVFTGALAQTDSSHQLNEVVVTGQFNPQSIKNSVYKIKTINAERIKARAATDVVGVLNSELGIRFNTDNTLGETDTKIMGLGTSRIKILLDGVPLADRDATKQSLTQIDINTIERIEIVEGPMSVVYGTDALAGVINIITKKPTGNGKHLSVGARVQEETIADTYKPFRDAGIHNENLNINWNNSHWKVGGYVTRNNFGGFTDTAVFPAQVFKPKQQWLGGGTVGYRTDKVNAWYRLDYANEDLFAAYPLNGVNISFRQHYLTNRYTHQAQIDWKVNAKLNINTAVSFQDYQRQTESYNKNYLTGNEEIATGAGYWDLTTFKTWFGRSTAAWIISPKVSIQSGFDIKYDKTTGPRILGEPSLTDYALFVSSEIKPTAAMSIRPGVRFSKNSVYDAPPAIPSINTKIALNNHIDLRMSYARGFRAPILRELYFDFRDANHTILGNENLKAETSNSYMVSVTTNQWSSKSVTTTSSISGFYNDYSDFIDTYGIPNSNVTSYFNLSKYKTVGGTFENTLAYKSLTASIGLSYIGYFNQYQEDHSLLGDRSKFAWSPEINSNITYRFTKLKGQIGFFYKFTGKIPSYIQDVQNNIVLAKRSAFHWADVTASKQLLKSLTVQAGVKNLFDVTRLNSTAAAGGAHSDGTITKYAYGRSYFLGLVLQLDKTY